LSAKAQRQIRKLKRQADVQRGQVVEYVEATVEMVESLSASVMQIAAEVEAIQRRIERLERLEGAEGDGLFLDQDGLPQPPPWVASFTVCMRSEPYPCKSETDDCPDFWREVEGTGPSVADALRDAIEKSRDQEDL
jgi:hypothetical protein